MNTGKWAISPMFDLVFFTGPVIIGLLYFLAIVQFPTHALAITILLWMVFAQGHFASTWFIYLDAKNKEHFKDRYHIYYVLPALIFVATVLIGLKSAALLFVVIAIVSFYHVTRQSIGILQIYRARNKEFDIREKYAEMCLLFVWGIYFTGSGAVNLPMFQTLLGTWLELARVGVSVFLYAGVALGLYVLACTLRRKENSLPKLAFLLVSTCLYLPYLYTTSLMIETQNFEVATITSLIPHYMQYMGLVWLINRNKYAAGSVHAALNPFLARLSQNVVYILGAIMAYAALMGYLHYAGRAFPGLLAALLPSIVAGLMMVHFFVDAFIWRFSNPHMREHVFPFIRRPDTIGS